MARIRVPISNFQYGEVSPSLISRTDTNVYGNSAKKIENFFLRSEGGLLKRFGTEKIYEFDTTVNSAKIQQIRLLPFIFSDDERYIVCLENAKIRVFIIDPSTGVVSLTATITADTNSAALPFDDDMLNEITFTQAGDVMFLAHQTFMTRKLVRTSLTAFQVETVTFSPSANGYKMLQPHYSFQGAGVTLDPSASDGNGITVTTSSPYFDITGSQTGGDYLSSKHVGVTLRYHQNEITITSVQSTTQATGNILDELYVHLEPDSIETTASSADIEITWALHGLQAGDTIVISNAGNVGGINANQINGTEVIQEIIDENVFVVTAGGSANESAIGGGSPRIVTHAPTTEWGEQSYSTLRGFPAAVAFHENRLWFGGTLGQPDGIWASRIGEYFNFDVGDAEDDDALDLTASIGEINTIRHIVSNRDLQIFTSTSELYIPAFTEKPITATNAQIKRQTPYGSSFVKPESLDGATIYSQKSGSIIREYIYSDAEAAYVATSISSLSSHIIDNPVQLSILRGSLNRPESYAFVLNQNGNIAVFTSDRAAQRAGWSEWTTNGSFHSICTVDDRVFVLGKYDKGNGTNKLILSELDSNKNLDFCANFTGTAGVFDVSSHFSNGAVVSVINGTDYLGDFTVAGGNVDVSAQQLITTAEIGYKYTVKAETNPIDANINEGPLTGEPRSISRVIVDVLETLSLSINGKRLVIRQVTDDLSQSRVPVTGKEEFRLMGYSKDPTVIITQTAPLPLQINGIIAEVSF